MVVFSTLALKGVLENFRAELERAVGPLELSFAPTQAILPRLAAGEKADLLFLTDEAARGLQAQGKLTEVCRLGRSGVGIAVRAGAPRPDIGSVDAFVRALTSAKSVAHSKVGASGLYFQALLKRLQVEDRVNRVVIHGEPVGFAVARGEAELGVQMLCELSPVPGIDIVGPLPEPLQTLTDFSAGIPVGAAGAKSAAALVSLLRTDLYRQRMLDGGIEPA